MIRCTIREINEDGATVGVLEAEGKDLFFIFREVKPVIAPLFSEEISLIFRKSFSQKFGDCWCLEEIRDENGEEIPHMGELTQKLSSRRILIHAGNVKEDSEGCLLPGKQIVLSPNVRVNHSKLALAELDKEKDDDGNTLTILIRGNFKAE